MQLLQNKLYMLLNHRELAIMDVDSKKIDLKVEFLDHTITCIFATPTQFFFGDTFNHLYLVNVADMHKDDPKGANLKKTRLIAHDSWIIHIDIVDGFLLSCSDDKNICVWQLPAGTIQLSSNLKR